MSEKKPFNWDDYEIVDDNARPAQPPQAVPAFDWDQYPVVDESRVDPTTSPVTAFTTGMAEGMLPGTASIAGAGKAAMDAITGTRGPLAGGSMGDLVEDYRQARDKFREDARTSQEANTYASIPTPIGGIPLGPGTVGNVIGASRNPVFQDVNTLPKMLKAGAIQGAASGPAELLEGDVKGAVEDVGYGMAGAGIGYGVGKTIQNVSPVFNRIAAKTNKLLGNIPEKNTMEFLERGSDLNPRTEFEILDDIAGKRQAKLDELTERQKFVETQSEQIKQTQQKAKELISNQKYETKNLLDTQKDQLRTKMLAARDALKNMTATGLKNEVLDSVRKLQDMVKEGSAKSYEILGDAEGSLRTAPILRTIDNELNNFHIRGKFATKGQEAAFKEIMDLRDRLQSLGPELSYPEAKTILQALDKETDYSGLAGQFDAIINRAKKNIRNEIDARVKTKVDPYKEQMEIVKKDTDLLNAVSEKFGTEERAIGRLEGLSSQKGRDVDFRLLKELGSKTGVNFEPLAQEFIDARDILNSPKSMFELMRNMPEYKRVKELEKFRSDLANPKMQDLVEERLRLPEMNSALDRALTELAKTEEEFKPYKPFGAGSQAKLRSMTGARNYDPGKMFEALDKATGENYSGEIRDRSILDSFKKTDAQGSRKTLMGKIAGKAVGTALGAGAGHLVGHEFIFAALGFGMDRFSGQVLYGIMNAKVGLTEGIQMLKPVLGEYAPVLVKAAQKGPQALGVTGAILSKDPSFRKKLDRLKDKRTLNPFND